ncbi:MAG: S26 family signal peptidase, partial [Minisyncoccia bacterium]
GSVWNIFVNNELLKTTAGIPYAINERTFTVFSQYINAVNGIVPQNEYLILGNLPAGSNDSLHFGFAQKKDLIAKVIIP